MGEIRAACRQPIEVGRLDELVAIRRDAIPALLVGHDEQNVRTARDFVAFVGGLG